MINADRAFETDFGIQLSDGVLIVSGAASPVGLDLPVGTVYFQVSSLGHVVWRKWGLNVANWSSESPGDFYQKAVSDAESNTSLSSYQTKVSLVTPSVPSAEYKISWSYEYAQSALLNLATPNTRVTDGTTVFAEQTAALPASNAWAPASGFAFSTFSGTKTFTIQFAAAAGIAYIRRARLEFVRV